MCVYVFPHGSALLLTCLPGFYLLFNINKASLCPVNTDRFVFPCGSLIMSVSLLARAGVVLDGQRGLLPMPLPHTGILESVFICIVIHN